MATRKKPVSGEILSGADLLAFKEQRLADKAEAQVEYLKAHPGWLPCSHRFSRPAGTKRGPAELACFGTVNPAYIREVEFNGRKYQLGECPRTADHNRLRGLMQSLGWAK